MPGALLMDETYRQLFVEATKNVFSMMADTEVDVSEVLVGQAAASARNNGVTGIIGLSGDVVGVVELGFPMATATAVVESFTGEATDPSDDDFSDAIGELVNMVSGSAKAKMAGRTVKISCPAVVISEGHRVQRPSNSESMCLLCTTASGDFSVLVCIRDSAATSDAVAHVANGSGAVE
ncbi:MAG: chemotaxis protein CheX [bacterium]|nr:chemotaxis protein CheX [bacterium]